MVVIPCFFIFATTSSIILIGFNADKIAKNSWDLFLK
jgi:hypothetical protein